MIEFEFDENKIRTNREKHGIDLYQAQELWKDPDLLEIPVATSDEPRFLLIGKLDQKFWSAVITYRKNIIRIISVRRARKEEIELYESI